MKKILVHIFGVFNTHRSKNLSTSVYIKKIGKIEKKNTIHNVIYNRSI